MFQNLKVLELASVLAGPSVGQFFAELGAQVIKVENPATSGDVTRSWLFNGEKTNGSVSAYFSSVNWGKRSIGLNIRDEQGLKILYALVKWSDMVIVSFKPGDAEKLKVDYETLSKINPALIYGHITGYGTADRRVGYDAVIQAESGFMSINGEKGGNPLKMPVALIDVLAGHHLKEGLLLALIRQNNTQQGDYVPVSLMDVAISSLANQGTNWLVGQKVPQRAGNEHPNIAPYGDVFTTSDGNQILLAVGNDKQFQGLSEILGLQLHVDPRFAANAQRVENRQALFEQLSAAIDRREVASLLAQLSQRKVPAGLVKPVNQALEDLSEDCLLEGGGLKGIRNFMGAPMGARNTSKPLPPPQFGEHTSHILKEKLDLTDQAIYELKMMKTVF